MPAGESLLATSPTDALILPFHLRGKQVGARRQTTAQTPPSWSAAHTCTVLSDPETHLFRQVAWDMANGDHSRLVRPDGSLAYYQADGRSTIYIADAPLEAPVDLAPQDFDRYLAHLKSLD